MFLRKEQLSFVRGIVCAAAFGKAPRRLTRRTGLCLQRERLGQRLIKEKIPHSMRDFFFYQDAAFF